MFAEKNEILKLIGKSAYTRSNELETIGRRIFYGDSLRRGLMLESSSMKQEFLAISAQKQK
jgi:hypothetical protein